MLYDLAGLWHGWLNLGSLVEVPGTPVIGLMVEGRPELAVEAVRHGVDGLVSLAWSDDHFAACVLSSFQPNVALPISIRSR